MKKIFFSLMLGGIVLQSCNRDNEEQEIVTPKEIVTEKTINASEYGTWKYFSFSKGEEVVVTDPATSLDWDIAFQRYYVKTNSGVSGKGKGGVFVVESKDFSNIKDVQATGYIVDDKSQEVTVGGPPNFRKIQMEYNSHISGGAKADVTTGYVTYDSGLMQIGRKHPYEMTKRVYIVKTADGNKYVKLQFTDYVNEKLKGGHPKFIYKIAENNKF